MPPEKAFCQLEAKTWVCVSGQQSPLREQGVHLLPRMSFRTSTTCDASVSSISQTLLKYKVSGQCSNTSLLLENGTIRGNSYNYMGFIRCNQIFS